jgi:uncharacterized protein
MNSHRKEIHFKDVRDFSERILSGLRGSHDWGHSSRVYALCMKIGRVEGADLEILGYSAFLHDVGRPFETRSKGLVCHAALGAQVARSLLKHASLPEEKKSNIVHSILTHRFRGGKPETLEAKVLFDADKLDAIGAIGIGRAYQFAGEVGARFHSPSANPEETSPYTEEDTGYREFRVKLSRIKEGMLTGEGERLARGRHDFMETFFERFFQELGGRL